MRLRLLLIAASAAGAIALAVFFAVHTARPTVELPNQASIYGGAPNNLLCHLTSAELQVGKLLLTPGRREFEADGRRCFVTVAPETCLTTISVKLAVNPEQDSATIRAESGSVQIEPPFEIEDGAGWTARVKTITFGGDKSSNGAASIEIRVVESFLNSVVSLLSSPPSRTREDMTPMPWIERVEVRGVKLAFNPEEAIPFENSPWALRLASLEIPAINAAFEKSSSEFGRLRQIEFPESFKASEVSIIYRDEHDAVTLAAPAITARAEHLLGAPDLDRFVSAVLASSTSLVHEGNKGTLLRLTLNEKSRITATEARAASEGEIQLEGDFPNASLHLPDHQFSAEAVGVTVQGEIVRGKFVGAVAGQVVAESMPLASTGMIGDASLSITEIKAEFPKDKGPSVTFTDVQVGAAQEAILKSLQAAIPEELPFADIGIGLDSELIKIDRLHGIKAVGLRNLTFNLADACLTFSGQAQVVGNLQVRKRFDKVEMRVQDIGLGIKTKLPYHIVRWDPHDFPFEVNVSLSGSASAEAEATATLADLSIQIKVACNAARIEGVHLHGEKLLNEVANLAKRFQDDFRIGGKSIPELLREAVSQEALFQPFAACDEQTKAWLKRLKMSDILLRQEEASVVIESSMRLEPIE